MEKGSKVIFYTKAQREEYPDIDDLFASMTTLGEIKTAGDGMHIVTWKNIIGMEYEEAIPEEFIRSARIIQWYNFWRGDGFYASLWGYFFFIMFFLIFIK